MHKDTATLRHRGDKEKKVTEVLTHTDDYESTI